MKYFLGVDGGQSHTTALIADEQGNILGAGGAGPSNHTREPGGRKRLIAAVSGSVAEALKAAGLKPKKGIKSFELESAHLAMTGEPEDKVEIIESLLTARHLVVGHDAQGALTGALAGASGIVVLAGTGSVACGELLRAGKRKFVRVGGHGYLFGDYGSAFGIARDAISTALDMEDMGEKTMLKKALLSFFGKKDLQSIARSFYSGEITRDQIASFTPQVCILAEKGDDLAQNILSDAATFLAEMAAVTAGRLGLLKRTVLVSYGGGVFNNPSFLESFRLQLLVLMSRPDFVKPVFNPDVGALLLAYRNVGIEISPDLLNQIKKRTSRNESLRD